jgi:hypothetical protein
LKCSMFRSATVLSMVRLCFHRYDGSCYLAQFRRERAKRPFDSGYVIASQIVSSRRNHPFRGCDKVLGRRLIAEAAGRVAR